MQHHAMQHPADGLLLLLSLPSGGRGYVLRPGRSSIAAGGAGEYAPTVGQLHRGCIAGQRPVLGQGAINGDLIAILESFLRPTVASQSVGRAALALPVRT